MGFRFLEVFVLLSFRYFTIVEYRVLRFCFVLGLFIS